MQHKSTDQNEPKPDPRPTPRGPLGARDIMDAFNSNTTGRFYAMSRRDRKFFNAHLRRIVEDYGPQSPRERRLANSIAEDMWRLDRARAIENNICALSLNLPIGAATLTDRGPAHTAITQARCWMEDRSAFQTLALLEQRLRRVVEKNERSSANFNPITKPPSTRLSKRQLFSHGSTKPKAGHGTPNGISASRQSRSKLRRLSIPA